MRHRDSVRSFAVQRLSVRQQRQRLGVSVTLRRLPSEKDEDVDIVVAPTLQRRR